MSDFTRISDLPGVHNTATINNSNAMNEHHRLPSRDIPMMDQNTLDDETIANYIPKSRQNNYIEEEEHYIDHRIPINYQSLIQFENTCLIAILYFMFQLPLLDRCMRKNLNYLGIYHLDGNVNVRGMLFKCILFSFSFFTINFLSLSI